LKIARRQWIAENQVDRAPQAGQQMNELIGVSIESFYACESAYSIKIFRPVLSVYSLHAEISCASGYLLLMGTSRLRNVSFAA